MSVRTHLRSLSSDLNLADNESSSIDTSISTLKRRLGYYFNSGRMVNRIQFGSSTRQTLLPRSADSESDVDYMVVFKNANDYNPSTFIRRLRKFAKDRYSSSQIAQSHPTVVLELNHIKLELVPAYRGWTSLLNIPAPHDQWNDWIVTDPNSFNSKLIKANKKYDYKIKPLVRLLKYWNAKNGHVYESYKLEKDVATNNWYYGCSNLGDYFYKAIDDLNTFDLPSYKTRKVNIAKRRAKKAKEKEREGLPITAENIVKKIVPSL